MNKKLIGLVVAIVLVVVIAVIVIVVLPVGLSESVVGGWLITAVKQKTGRDLAFTKLSLTLFPEIRISADGATLSDSLADDVGSGGGVPMLRLGRIDAAASIIPLLYGSIDLRRLTIADADLRLTVRPDRGANWLFSPPAATTPFEATSSLPAKPATSMALSELRLGDVRIAKFGIVYEDQITGQTITVADGGLEMRMPSLDATAAIKGSAVVNGKPVKLSITVTEPRALMETRPTEIITQVKSELASLSGDIKVVGDGHSAGPVSLSVPNLAELRNWLRLPGTMPAAVKAIRFSGSIALTAGKVELSPFEVAADDAKVAGAISLDLSGPRPKVSGSLRVSPIELDRFLAKTSARATTPVAASSLAKASVQSAASMTQAPAQATAVEPDLPWDDLRKLNLDLKLALAGVTIRGDRFGPSQAVMVLNNGALALDLGDTPAFGGTMAIKLRADAGSHELSVASTLSGIGLRPVLEQAGLGRAERLTMSGNLTLAGHGATRAAFAEKLTGRGVLALAGTKLSLGNSERPIDVERLALNIDLPGLDRAIVVDGDVKLRGQPLKLRLDIAGPRALVAGKSTDVALSLQGPPLTASFKGGVDLAGSFNGRVSLVIPSLANAAGLIQFDVPDVPSIRSVRYDGAIARTPVRDSLSDFTLMLDEAKAVGTMSVERNRAVPQITSRLTLEGLDLDRLLKAAPEKAASEKATKSLKKSSKTTAPSAPASSTIDAGLLRTFNLDAVIDNRGLRFGGVQLGASKLTVLLQDGRLSVDAPSLPVFGGLSSTVLKLDAARPAQLGLALRVKAEGIKTEDMMVAVADSHLIRGITAIDLDVTASGRSQQELIAALAGTTKLAMGKGTLLGINIAAILRDPIAAATGRSNDAGRETDFSELGASFRIDHGIARTNDMTMLAPQFRVTGAGTVGLPERKLDLHLEPMLTGTTAVSNIAVPVLITGSFEQPRIEPDFSAVLSSIAKDPAKAADAIKRLKEGGKPAAILRDLLGGKPADGNQPPPSSPPPSSPADVLDKALSGKAKPRDILKGLDSLLRR
ncbi:MAG: AsmA family protein [Rhodospirillaceae bacterium]